jgi:hypothetical protein
MAYKSVLFISYFTPNTEEYRNFTNRVKIKSQQLFNYTYQSDEEVSKIYSLCLFTYRYVGIGPGYSRSVVRFDCSKRRLNGTGFFSMMPQKPSCSVTTGVA